MAWPERMSSGRWRGVYRDANSPPRRHTVVGEDGLGFAGKREAKAAATEEEVKAKRRASRRAPAATMTWGEWWDRIVEDRDFPASDNAKTEASLVKNHIRPRWGDEPLGSIAQADVQKWVNSPSGLKVRRGMAASSVRRIYGLFATTIHLAVDEGVLDASPCIGITLPRVPVRTLPTLKVGDSEQLEREDYRDAVDFMIETFLRPSEVCGLHVHLVGDPRPGWLRVKHVYVPRRNIIRPWPKDEDERYVPMTPKAMEIAERRMHGRELTGGCGVRHYGSEQCRTALVFLTEHNRPMRPGTLASYLAARGLASPYGGRRGGITRALDGGANPTDVSFMAGHASVGQTQGYWQASEAVRDRIIAAAGQHEGLSAVADEGHRRANRGAKPRHTLAQNDTTQPGETTG